MKLKQAVKVFPQRWIVEVNFLMLFKCKLIYLKIKKKIKIKSTALKDSEQKLG